MENHQSVSPDKLAECLISFFKYHEDPTTTRFVMEISKQVINKYKSGCNQPEVTSKDVFLEIFPSEDLSKVSEKLSNIWRKMSPLQIEVAKRLSEHAHNEFSLDEYPWIEKIKSNGGAGNLTKFRVIGIRINKSELCGPNPYRETIHHDIEYIAIQDYKPSLLARLIFDKTNAMIGGKKWGMIFFSFIEMFFYLCVIALFFFSMKNQTLATYPLWQLAVLIGAILLFLQKKKRIDRFIDDRIIIASELFMGWAELSLVQELVTVNDEKGNFLYKKVQLTKYVAICPICNAQVELAKGEPDFLRRIIGRCKESPREHIYSFDRVTKLGVLLHQNATRYNV